MRAHHDLGGTAEGPIDTRPHEPSLFDRRVDALMMLLAGQGFFSIDSQRRVNENLPPEDYKRLAYYEKWMNSIGELMVERKVFARDEIGVRCTAVAGRLQLAWEAARDVGADHHDHGHGEHGHDADDAHAAIEHPDRPPSPYEVLEEAVRELCIERGFFTAAEVQRQIENMDARTPAQGARLVARAWTDPAFYARVMADAKAAAEEMGIDMSTSPELQAVQNTPGLHHMVVCTLCSCYPRALLGIPPTWYKSRAYRARVVKDPRGVLAEFGTELPDSTRIHVVDSTADLRYVVIPVRPAGTNGWDADRLAALVSRDSLVGVALARSPQA